MWGFFNKSKDQLRDEVFYLSKTLRVLADEMRGMTSVEEVSTFMSMKHQEGVIGEAYDEYDAFTYDQKVMFLHAMNEINKIHDANTKAYRDEQAWADEVPDPVLEEEAPQQAPDPDLMERVEALEARVAQLEGLITLAGGAAALYALVKKTR